LDVIKCADWIIDLGPSAGIDGGELVFAGTPEDLGRKATEAKKKSRRKNGKPQSDSVWHSPTGEFLRSVLEPSLATGTTKTRAKRSNVKNHTRPDAEKKSLRVDAAEPTPSPKMAQRGKDARTSTSSKPDNQPWKVLGRRWHSLSKGFPQDASPQWPLELADKTLSLLEKIAGNDSLAFDYPDRVNVRPDGARQTWAEVQTKTPESVKVTLAGPRDAIDLEQLKGLGVESPVDISNQGRARVTLNLTEIKHTRSRKLKSFLKCHLDRTVNA
jgi:excinuclease ABC subunit A